MDTLFDTAEYVPKVVNIEDVTWSGDRLQRLNYNGVLYKWCGTGRHWQPLDAFSSNRYTRDGIHQDCRVCANDLNKTLKAIAKHRIPLLEKQGYMCAICGRDLSEAQPRHSVVDHDHDTGVVRGVLCHNCNTGIGRFSDNVELLEKAIEYLTNSRGCAIVPDMDDKRKYLDTDDRAEERHMEFTTEGDEGGDVVLDLDDNEDETSDKDGEESS